MRSTSLRKEQPLQSDTASSQFDTRRSIRAPRGSELLFNAAQRSAAQSRNSSSHSASASPHRLLIRIYVLHDDVFHGATPERTW